MPAATAGQSHRRAGGCGVCGMMRLFRVVRIGVTRPVRLAHVPVTAIVLFNASVNSCIDAKRSAGTFSSAWFNAST